MVDLGTLGGRETYAVAINDRGQVTGDSETGTPNQTSGPAAFIWSRGKMTALGTDGEGRALNNRGQVAGIEGLRAVLWCAA